MSDFQSETESNNSQNTVIPDCSTDNCDNCDNNANQNLSPVSSDETLEEAINSFCLTINKLLKNNNYSELITKDDIIITYYADDIHLTVNFGERRICTSIPQFTANSRRRPSHGHSRLFRTL